MHALASLRVYLYHQSRGTEGYPVLASPRRGSNIDDSAQLMGWKLQFPRRDFLERR